MAANLTTAAIQARKGVKFSIYFLMFVIATRTTWGIFKTIYKAVVPPKVPPPTVKYGILPKIAFPLQKENLTNITYTIQTASGSLPAFPIQMNVYLMPKNTASLNSTDNAQKKAQSLGYLAEPIEVAPAIYRFTHPLNPSTFEINIINNTFSIDYNLSANPTITNSPLSDTLSAKASAESTLSVINLQQVDLGDLATFDYLSIEGQSLISVLSLSEADAIKVNIYRNPIEISETTKYNFVYSNPKSTNVWFIVAGQKAEVLSAQYKYYKVDYTNFETYPIKTASQAFSDLQAGKGYVASLGNNKLGAVTIRRIYLAYYDPDLPSQFLQPVVVFEGDNDFVAYVPAVTSEYYTN